MLTLSSLLLRNKTELNLELFIVCTSVVPDELIKAYLSTLAITFARGLSFNHEQEFVVRTEGKQMLTRRESDHNHWQ